MGDSSYLLEPNIKEGKGGKRFKYIEMDNPFYIPS